MESIYCPVRKNTYKATPEEQVRVAFLHFLNQEKGVPFSQISVEVDVGRVCLEGLPPNSLMRIDILVWNQGKPLLLVECKKNCAEEDPALQLARYNLYIKAPFLAWADSRTMGWRSLLPLKSSILEGPLPSYKELCAFELARHKGGF